MQHASPFGTAQYSARGCLFNRSAAAHRADSFPPQIWHQDGIRGFYRGCSANLLRTTPAAALTFTTFELIARNMRASAATRKEQAAAPAR